MATLPIPGLLAEFEILGLQAMDFGAQLSHFRARVLHWGDQLREEMTGKTDLCQLADHDQLGLPEIAPKGKGLVLLQPEQKNQKERDGQRFTKRPGRRGGNKAKVPRGRRPESRARVMADQLGRVAGGRWPVKPQAASCFVRRGSPHSVVRTTLILRVTGR